MSNVPCTSPLGLSVIACAPLDNQEEAYTSTLDCQEEKKGRQVGEKGFAPSVLGHLSKKEGTSLASTQDAGELDSWLADICVAQGDVAGAVEHARAAAQLQPFACCYS